MIPVRDQVTLHSVLEEDTAVKVALVREVPEVATDGPGGEGGGVVGGAGVDGGEESVVGAVVSGGGLMWNNTRLHPPYNKTSSIAWKFGGFRKVGGRLDLGHTICSFCGKEQRYRQMPTNLVQHVMSQHALEYNAIAQGNLLKTTNGTTINNFFQKKTNQLRQTDPKQK